MNFQFWIICLFTVFTLLIVIEIIAYIFAKKLSYIKIEFPQISQDLVDKFTTYDYELGWEPKINSVKKDVGHSNAEINKDKAIEYVTYTIDHTGSRSFSLENLDLSNENTISTYGDSFCFCREVEDYQTFQYYLSQKINTKVSNFGVGNYGLDQAVLRLKKCYPLNPTKYVIMAITPCTIERIASVWKHYSEYGNILAAKPRFILEGKELKLVSNFIKRKSDFADIEGKADWIRRHDYHYKNWFLEKEESAKFSYTLFFLRKKERMYNAMEALAKKINFKGVENYYKNKKKIDFAKSEYFKECFQVHEQLFISIAEEFYNYSKEKDFVPIFLMLSHYRDIKYMKENGNYYKDALVKLKKKCDDIVLIDYFDYLKDKSDDYLISLYVQPNGRGHHSPKGNRVIAEILEDEIQKLVSPE